MSSAHRTRRPGKPTTSASHPRPAATSAILKDGYSIWSWLFTVDHKRIGILYLVFLTLFFAVGGMFAGLVRLNLISPTGAIMDNDTYNKTFTAHGVVMLFLFLIPSIPAMMGNFFVPIMIGAKDMAFPKLNLASWYVWMAGAAISLHLGSLLTGGLSIPDGRSIRRIAHVPVTATWSPVSFWRVHHRVQLDHDGLEHPRDDSPHARHPRHDLGPAAALLLGHVCDQHDPASGHTRARHRGSSC